MQKLYHKYKIEKTNGNPTDPTAQYFVLRIDTDQAARKAMITYANEMTRVGDVDFANQILEWLERYSK